METFSKPSSRLNVGHDLEIILRIVASLEGRYGASYLVRLLRGQKSLSLRKDAHADMPQFGAMHDYHADTIRGLINYLVREGFLQVSSAKFGSLEVTPRGEAFLAEPTEVWVQKSAITLNAFDRMLMNELRQVRKEIAASENIPPYRIFTDYTMQQIVDQKPEDLESLRLISGIGEYKADRYGAAIFLAISQTREEKAANDRIRLMKKVQSPSHQGVKSMFEAGASVEEIAEKRSIQPGTVKRMLQTLHQAGSVDLKPWIREQVRSEVLEKGVEYFRREPQSGLRDAYEKLGLDYDTLKMCRLYVAGYTSVEEELKFAS